MTSDRWSEAFIEDVKTVLFWQTSTPDTADTKSLKPLHRSRHYSDTRLDTTRHFGKSRCLVYVCQTRLINFLKYLNTMHPIDFKKKWQLTYDELALVLGYQSDFTVRCWGINGKHKRKEVKKLSMSLADFLMRSGQLKGNLWILISDYLYNWGKYYVKPVCPNHYILPFIFDFGQSPNAFLSVVA